MEISVFITYFVPLPHYKFYESWDNPWWKYFNENFSEFMVHFALLTENSPLLWINKFHPYWKISYFISITLTGIPTSSAFLLDCFGTVLICRKKYLWYFCSFCLLVHEIVFFSNVCWKFFYWKRCEKWLKTIVYNVFSRQFLFEPNQNEENTKYTLKQII